MKYWWTLLYQFNQFNRGGQNRTGTSVRFHPQYSWIFLNHPGQWHEHRPAEGLDRTGTSVQFWPRTGDGRIDLNGIEATNTKYIPSTCFCGKTGQGQVLISAGDRGRPNWFDGYSSQKTEIHPFNLLLWLRLILSDLVKGLVLLRTSFMMHSWPSQGSSRRSMKCYCKIWHW